jgi:hypothetical protein
MDIKKQIGASFHKDVFVHGLIDKRSTDMSIALFNLRRVYHG